MARRGLRGADVHRHARARPGRRRAEPRRPEAPAGPRLADRVEGARSGWRSRVPARGERRGRGRCGELPGERSGLDARARTATATSRAAGRAAPRSPIASRRSAPVTLADGTETELDHGHVVIAAITSCTNTSNPSVMLGAGLLARNAVQRGLQVKPWVKTSLAPGSKVVTEYLDRAGLTEYLDELGFNLVGYGCTTCIGNSGPLPEEISDVVGAEDLAVVSVLSGNRNFEGRINPDVQMNYLASPPLVVAYALAGTMDIDLYDEPLGEDDHGEAGFLKDIWPTAAEVAETVGERRAVGHVPQELRRGVRRRRALELARGADRRSVRLGRALDVRAPPAVLRGAAARARAGRRTSRTRACSRCSATASPPTTSRRPARSSATAPPAAYLIEHGVAAEGLQLLRLAPRQPRGDDARHVRQHPARNQLAPGTEGGVTRVPRRWRRREQMSIYDAAMKYIDEGVPLVVLAGKEYGSGSLARLGGEGHAPARRARRDRRELRADPPLEPRRHGRAAAPVRRRRVGRVARPDRRGDVQRSPGSPMSTRSRAR